MQTYSITWTRALGSHAPNQYELKIWDLPLMKNNSISCFSKFSKVHMVKFKARKPLNITFSFGSKNFCHFRCLSGSGSLGQLYKQRPSDLPLAVHLLQLFWRCNLADFHFLPFTLQWSNVMHCVLYIQWLQCYLKLNTVNCARYRNESSKLWLTLSLPRWKEAAASIAVSADNMSSYLLKTIWWSFNLIAL